MEGDNPWIISIKRPTAVPTPSVGLFLVRSERRCPATFGAPRTFILQTSLKSESFSCDLPPANLTLSRAFLCIIISFTTIPMQNLAPYKLFGREKDLTGLASPLMPEKWGYALDVIDAKLERGEYPTPEQRLVLEFLRRRLGQRFAEAEDAIGSMLEHELREGEVILDPVITTKNEDL